MWLFGSIHVGTDEMYPLPGYVLDAYAEADALAVECDILAAQEDMSIMVAAMQKLLYTDGTKISDHISEELYNSAVEIFKENNAYMPAMDYYMPVMWFSLIDSFLIAGLGYDSEKGVDMHLMNKARKDNKPIREIESVMFQYDALASFSPELQVLLLEDTVANFDNPLAQASTKMLIKAWCKGEAKTIAALTAPKAEGVLSADQQALLEEFNTVMLTNRNLGMTEFAASALENGEKVFICVGVAHVVGPGAMADLLARQGYTVEQVS